MRNFDIAINDYIITWQNVIVSLDLGVSHDHLRDDSKI